MRKNKKQKESQDKLCIDCAKFDNCKFADEDGMACTEYDEVKYILTPKGAWISACMSELGGDESDLEQIGRAHV